MPSVSIIIPAFNAADTIENCLRTIFHQSYEDFEVIVVDDGSTDATIDALNPFLNQIRLIRVAHAGAAAARNAGAREASGEFILFCDADMALDPHMIEKMVNVLRRKPDASFAYAGFLWHNRIMGMDPYDARELKRNNFIHTSSLIRREHFPGFDEKLHRFQDWDLWLTMVGSGRRGTGIPLVLYAARRGSISGRGGIARLRATQILRKKHGLRMIPLDYWLAFKELIRPWIFRS